MLSEFQNFFKNFKFLSTEDLKCLYEMARIRKYSKGEHLVKEGQNFPFGIHIVKGLVRNYIINSNGDDRTLKFTDKIEVTGVPECLFLDLPSPEFVQAIEDSTVILFNEKRISQVTLSHPNLLKLKIDRMNKIACEMASRIRSYTTLTPEERYIDLIEQNPTLIDRVEDQYLASYIGVTSVSYSRIKTRIKKRFISHS